MLIFKNRGQRPISSSKSSSSKPLNIIHLRNRALSPIFITATDTNVGKTVATYVLGVLLQESGIDVGVMKPVQCAGNDAQFLKKSLGLKDDLALINPIFAPEPLSPHLALRRSKKKFDLEKIKRSLKELQSRHEQILIEGAGGLMVPLAENYYTVDLIRDLKAEVIIVSRLGLGTINHTLLTINQAKAKGLKIKGIIFSDTKPGAKSVAERTNPQEIERLSGIKVLGTISYIKQLKQSSCHCERFLRSNLFKKMASSLDMKNLIGSSP